MATCVAGPIRVTNAMLQIRRVRSGAMYEVGHIASRDVTLGRRAVS